MEADGFGPDSLFAFKVAFELVFRDEPILFKDAVRQLRVQPGEVAFPNLERPALADIGELMSVANIRIACRKKLFPRTCRDLTRRGVSSSRRRGRVHAPQEWRLPQEDSVPFSLPVPYAPPRIDG